MRRPGDGTMFKRPNYNRHQLKKIEGLFTRFKITVILVVILIIYFVFSASKIDYLQPESPPEVRLVCKNYGIQLMLVIGGHHPLLDLTGLLLQRRAMGFYVFVVMVV